MLTSKLDAIYIINEKKFTDRRVFMEAQLAQLQMQAEFISAYGVEELTDKIISQYFVKDSLTLTQMSCAMKHIVALQKIAARNSPYNLVLEDDAVLSKDFNLGIHYALVESEKFSGCKIIYIGSAGNHFIEKSEIVEGQHLYLASRGRYTDSYIIDSETAGKRLAWIEDNKIDKPIDDQFDFIDIELGIKMLWLEDPVVEQGSKNGLFKSEIVYTTAGRPQWFKSIRFRLQKFRRKYLYPLFR